MGGGTVRGEEGGYNVEWQRHESDQLRGASAEMIFEKRVRALRRRGIHLAAASSRDNFVEVLGRQGVKAQGSNDLKYKAMLRHVTRFPEHLRYLLHHLHHLSVPEAFLPQASSVAVVCKVNLWDDGETRYSEPR